MKAYLTFTRIIDNKLNIIGVDNSDNNIANKNCELISGQPIICVCDKSNLKALYIINESGDIHQCLGNDDLLFSIKTIKDISLLNIYKYNTIKFFLISTFGCLSLKELSLYNNNLKCLEDKIFYNLLHTEIDIAKLKTYILREINKFQLKYEIKQRLIKQLKLTKNPSKKLLRKKIDVDLFGYDIYINTLVN